MGVFATPPAVGRLLHREGSRWDCPVRIKASPRLLPKEESDPIPRTSPSTSRPYQGSFQFWGKWYHPADSKWGRIFQHHWGNRMHQDLENHGRTEALKPTAEGIGKCGSTTRRKLTLFLKPTRSIPSGEYSISLCVYVCVFCMCIAGWRGNLCRLFE